MRPGDVFVHVNHNEDERIQGHFAAESPSGTALYFTNAGTPTLCPSESLREATVLTTLKVDVSSTDTPIRRRQTGSLQWVYATPSTGTFRVGMTLDYNNVSLGSFPTQDSAHRAALTIRAVHQAVRGMDTESLFQIPTQPDSPMHDQTPQPEPLPQPSPRVLSPNRTLADYPFYPFHVDERMTRPIDQSAFTITSQSIVKVEATVVVTRTPSQATQLVPVPSTGIAIALRVTTGTEARLWNVTTNVFDASSFKRVIHGALAFTYVSIAHLANRTGLPLQSLHGSIRLLCHNQQQPRVLQDAISMAMKKLPQFHLLATIGVTPLHNMAEETRVTQDGVTNASLISAAQTALTELGQQLQRQPRHTQIPLADTLPPAKPEDIRSNSSYHRFMSLNGNANSHTLLIDRWMSQAKPVVPTAYADLAQSYQYSNSQLSSALTDSSNRLTSENRMWHDCATFLRCQEPRLRYLQGLPNRSFLGAVQAAALDQSLSHNESLARCHYLRHAIIDVMRQDTDRNTAQTAIVATLADTHGDIEFSFDFWTVTKRILEDRCIIVRVSPQPQQFDPNSGPTQIDHLPNVQRLRERWPTHDRIGFLLGGTGTGSTAPLNAFFMTPNHEEPMPAPPSPSDLHTPSGPEARQPSDTQQATPTPESHQPTDHTDNPSARADGEETEEEAMEEWLACDYRLQAELGKLVEMLGTKEPQAGPQSGVFTDGSSSPNPGPGGWGVVAVQKGRILWRSRGTEPVPRQEPATGDDGYSGERGSDTYSPSNTTNNRMEFAAVIEALSRLPENEPGWEIFSDSELVVNTLEKWAAEWKRNGWTKTKKGQKSTEIANLDLVKKAYALRCARPLVNLRWIKAHARSTWNEYADALAKPARGSLPLCQQPRYRSDI